MARLGSSDTTAWRGQSSVDKYSVPDRSPQANSTMPSGQRSRLCREYARSAARFLTAAALRGRAATGCGLLVARVRGGAGLGGGHPGHDTGAPHPYTFGAVCRRTTPASLQGTTAELSAKLGCARAQERNVKYPNGGQEASRVTAAARRKLGSLGSAVENLRELLDGPQCADACALSSALRARSRLQSRGGGNGSECGVLLPQDGEGEEQEAGPDRQPAAAARAGPAIAEARQPHRQPVRAAALCLASSGYRLTASGCLLGWLPAARQTARQRRALPARLG